MKPDHHPFSTEKVTVFFDGSCPLCTAEIDFYQRADTQGALKLVDVSCESFSGDNRLSQKQAMARLHVRLADGKQISGAGGFFEMWRAIPSWRWLAGISRIPGAMTVMEGLYLVFLQIRPLIVWVFSRLHRAPSGSRK